jgi:hypothetical protein
MNFLMQLRLENLTKIKRGRPKAAVCRRMFNLDFDNLKKRGIRLGFPALCKKPTRGRRPNWRSKINKRFPIWCGVIKFALRKSCEPALKKKSCLSRQRVLFF